MVVATDNGRVMLSTNQGPPENSCRPAVDVLFRSVAAVYKSHALAVVMTGMGQDGLRGCEQIREGGGQILAQDQATSVVWGMPGFVANAGLADKVLPLDQIGLEILRRVRNGRESARELKSASRNLASSIRR
jgi:two-component system chemotaxis response regulator CheB